MVTESAGQIGPLPWELGLSEQYAGVALQVLSITMYLTRSPQIIFGATSQREMECYWHKK